VVECFIKEGGADIDAVVTSANDIQTAISLAALCGHCPLVKWLIEEDALLPIEIWKFFGLQVERADAAEISSLLKVARSRSLPAHLRRQGVAAARRALHAGPPDPNAAASVPRAAAHVCGHTLPPSCRPPGYGHRLRPAHTRGPVERWAAVAVTYVTRKPLLLKIIDVSWTSTVP
jgi:hypothetical protein